jgi:hypothetical protein
MSGKYFAPQITDEAKPIAHRLVESVIDLAAQHLRDGGAFSGGGNRDLKIAAAHDGGKIEAAIRRIIDGIAENCAPFRFGEHRMIHIALGRGRNHEELSFKIARLEWTRQPLQFSGGGELAHVVNGCRRNDCYTCARFQKGRNFCCAYRAGADDEARASGKLDENRKQRRSHL